MPYTPGTKTLNDVLTQVKRTFGDEAGVQVSQSDVTTWTNDAVQEIIARTKVLKSKSSTSSVAGQADYTFPALRIHDIDALHYKGALLRNVTFSQAQQLYIGSLVGSGDQPSVWWEYAGTFTLWPTPPDVGAIDIFATVYPPPVAALTDLLGLPDKFYRQIVQYVLQQAYELDEDLELASFKKTQFTEGLTNFNEEERTAQHMVFDGVTLVDYDS